MEQLEKQKNEVNDEKTKREIEQKMKHKQLEKDLAESKYVRLEEGGVAHVSCIYNHSLVPPTASLGRRVW